MKSSALKESQLNRETIAENSSSQFLQNFFTSCFDALGEDNFNKWISPLELYQESESEVILTAPSKFIRDWVIREFLEVKKNKTSLLNLAQEIKPSLKKLSVIYKAKSIDDLDLTLSKKEQKVVNLSKYDNVFTFGAELNKKFTFENFISAKYNKMAISMAKIAAGLDKQINLFEDKIPLYIHGGVGMGKTHLAQAIAWKIKESEKSKKVIYMSAEKFMYHFVKSIRNNDVMSFKEKMRSIDVLIVDDVQFIAGKESTQQEFMNCYNSLVEDNKQVILVCDRCPSDLENIDEKLKSRISGGMVINFKNADYRDRLTIVKEKSQQFTEEEFGEDVVSFIAEKINTSIRDLEGALKKLIAENLFDEKEISLENAKTILSSYVRKSNSKAVNIEKIQKIVANFYNIKISDLTSSSRLRTIARPRQIAMYLCKTLTSSSLPKIGKEFGGKNHATVLHSYKLVKDLINEDKKTLQEIKTLEEKLK